ncbi:MAG TPA: hypothetical protein VL307_10845, partial [Chitinophagaceae bacterium]|nr:hypothetical protein [Chitinophagaceae bacterium]
ISYMQGQNKYEQLYGLNVKELLATALSIPAKAVMMDNDAACFLQGEVFAGAATAFEQQTVIGLTLGTGLGTAIYRNGKASNADLWRIPFNNGIAEDFLSSTWCVSQYRSVTGRQLNGVHELAARLPGDADAKAVLEMFGQQLANFLLLFIAREQPAAVCIGGNIAKAFSLFGSIVVDTIGHAHPQIPVFTSALGEEAMVLGAVASAVLPLQQTFPGTLSL